ncbi:MAG: hypothetical protein P8X58_13970, partial [Syntrophobacterales bacterium]
MYGKSVRDETVYPEFALGQERQTGLQIAAFGPADVAEGVVETFGFVKRVKTAGAGGFGNRKK